jgi:hypothetical protein
VYVEENLAVMSIGEMMLRSSGGSVGMTVSAAAA